MVGRRDEREYGEVITVEIDRRVFLTTVGAAGLAGCSDFISGSESNDGTDGRTDNEPAEDDADAANASTESETNVVDDFEELEHWRSGEVELLADTEFYLTGTQSARHEASETGEAVQFERTDLSLDLTDRRLAMACCVHADDVSTQTLGITVEDGDENQLLFRAQVGKTGEDTDFSYRDFGVHSVLSDTAPNLGAIESIQLQPGFEDTAGTIWFDDLSLVEMPDVPKLMIQWDDGFESQYTEGFPIQSRYDIPSTIFVITDRIGGEGYLTLEQLEEMYDHGWEIASHLMTHPRLSELSPEEQETEIRGAKDWLIDHGFEADAEYFAYPFGDYDQSSYELIKEYHTIAMVRGEPGHGVPTDPALVGRGVGQTLEDATEYIDRLTEWGGVGGLLWHGLPDETPIDEFDAIMAYIHEREEAGDLEVITLSDLEGIIDELAIDIDEA